MLEFAENSMEISIGSVVPGSGFWVPNTARELSVIDDVPGSRLGVPNTTRDDFPSLGIASWLIGSSGIASSGLA